MPSAGFKSTDLSTENKYNRKQQLSQTTETRIGYEPLLGKVHYFIIGLVFLGLNKPKYL